MMSEQLCLVAFECVSLESDKCWPRLPTERFPRKKELGRWVKCKQIKKKTMKWLYILCAENPPLKMGFFCSPELNMEVAQEPFILLIFWRGRKWNKGVNILSCVKKKKCNWEELNVQTFKLFTMSGKNWIYKNPIRTHEQTLRAESHSSPLSSLHFLARYASSVSGFLYRNEVAVQFLFIW